MCTRNQAFEILKIVYHACDPILGHSIHDAILYGSYARGDFTAESDIDIPDRRFDTGTDRVAAACGFWSSKHTQP